MTSLDRLLAHPDVVRLRWRLAELQPQTIAPDSEDGARYAAIALVLRPARDHEPELLMIKRAEDERDPWSGHIACPGGRMDPGDRDLEQTAVRETWEETGVDLARDGLVLGRLDDITPRTQALPPLIIRPFVAAVKPEVTIVANPEVAEAFWVPLAAIRESASWGRGLVSVRGMGEREVDVFTHGAYTVWGLTHRALRQFLDLVEE